MARLVRYRNIATTPQKPPPTIFHDEYRFQQHNDHDYDGFLAIDAVADGGEYAVRRPRLSFSFGFLVVCLVLDFSRQIRGVVVDDVDNHISIRQQGSDSGRGGGGLKRMLHLL